MAKLRRLGLGTAWAVIAALAGVVLSLAPTSVAAPPVSEDRAKHQMAAPIEVIVKFKEDRIVKEIVDSFWVEPEQARRCFERFKQGRAEFKEARLVRVTYSGELVLAFPLPAAAAERRAASQDLLARLNGIADVAYAEPDHTASVQGP